MMESMSFIDFKSKLLVKVVKIRKICIETFALEVFILLLSRDHASQLQVASAFSTISFPDLQSPFCRTDNATLVQPTASLN